MLKLGAGTGKFTASLVAQGHDVLASEPDRAMLDVLSSCVPGARTVLAAAESLPIADDSQDVVVAAQCFHWLDHAAALPEIARVLRPCGVLAVVWNHRDERIPWVRRLGDLTGTQEQLSDPTDVVAASGLFEPPSSESFENVQDMNLEILIDLVSSRSNVFSLDEVSRRAVIAEVRALHDDPPPGYDVKQLPYITRCFRSHVATCRSATGELDPQPLPARSTQWSSLEP